MAILILFLDIYSIAKLRHLDHCLDLFLVKMCILRIPSFIILRLHLLFIYLLFYKFLPNLILLYIFSVASFTNLSVTVICKFKLN